MNAELHAHGRSTIIIPTVFRDDYIGALREFSLRDRVNPIVNALEKAHLFSCFDFSKYQPTLAKITACNWFFEPDEAQLKLDSVSV